MGAAQKAKGKVFSSASSSGVRACVREGRQKVPQIKSRRAGRIGRRSRSRAARLQKANGHEGGEALRSPLQSGHSLPASQKCRRRGHSEQGCKRIEHDVGPAVGCPRVQPTARVARPCKRAYSAYLRCEVRRVRQGDLVSEARLRPKHRKQCKWRNDYVFRIWKVLSATKERRRRGGVWPKAPRGPVSAVV